MIYDLLAFISSSVITVISASGYFGIMFLMALESACIPIPSEVIMPFSGFLVFSGRFSFWLTVFWGAIGNLFGSVLAYLAGYYGGRPVIERYGKYIFISKKDLEGAQEWFKKYGSVSVFFSRMLPVVRTFISLPAGISKMPFWKFCIYTLLGSLPWSFLLTYAGVITGENWSSLEKYFRKFDWLILILIVLAGAIFIYKKVKDKKL